MNYLAAVADCLEDCLTGPVEGTEFWESPALSRLASPYAGLATRSLAAHAHTSQMLEMSWNLLEMLTQLIGGASSPPPGRCAGPISPESRSGKSPFVGQGGSGNRQTIAGGKALYKHGMFHKGAKGAPDSYAFENSPAGIKFAAEHGYSSIDLDMQITKDGALVATHWSRPMLKDGFYDPQHKLDPKTKIKDMTLAEVMRLRNRDGQSQIYPLSTMVGLLKEHGIAGDLEAKDDARFASDAVMSYLSDLVRDSEIQANLKSIDRGERSDKILQKAQEYGFWVRTAQAKGSARRVLGYR